MAVYGAILGAMEAKAMELAVELNVIVNEDMFREYPNLVSYLEAYSALEIHVMVRFGRWMELLDVELPADKNLMLYRTASIRYGRALAYAMTGDLIAAGKEADRFDSLRRDHPDANVRILHNNSVADLLAVDAVMVRGEIAYRLGKHEDGLTLLRKAVEMQDNLNYDEPWGKMQPTRHALGGLLLEQEQLDEAEAVFRKDLKFHPRNPWALVGLIRCLKLREHLKSGSSSGSGVCCAPSMTMDIASLKEQLRVQRQMEWADYNVVVACECCVHPE
jgi:tetratricopeptide (TPR) repeat protein